jgi:hypothetical protein
MTKKVNPVQSDMWVAHTSELRWLEGTPVPGWTPMPPVLQQKFILTLNKTDGTTEVVVEWRDVPTERV